MYNERIRDYREDKDLTQEELAKMLGIKREQLSKYERGIQTPSIIIIKKICDVLEIKIDDLFK